MSPDRWYYKSPILKILGEFVCFWGLHLVVILMGFVGPYDVRNQNPGQPYAKKVPSLIYYVLVTLENFIKYFCCIYFLCVVLLGHEMCTLSLYWIIPHSNKTDLNFFFQLHLYESWLFYIFLYDCIVFFN